MICLCSPRQYRSSELKFCPECGAKLLAFKCQCGNAFLSAADHFCPSCGKPVPVITIGKPVPTNAELANFDEGYSAGLRDGMRLLAPQCSEALRDAADTLAQVHDTHIYGDDDHHPDNDCSYCKQVEGWRKLGGLLARNSPTPAFEAKLPQVVKGGQR